MAAARKWASRGATPGPGAAGSAALMSKISNEGTFFWWGIQVEKCHIKNDDAAITQHPPVHFLWLPPLQRRARGYPNELRTLLKSRHEIEGGC